MTEDIDLEREKNKSFELGHIAKLEDLAEELRERAGEIYAHADNHKERAKADQLKELARDYEERAKSGREAYGENYDE